MGPDDYIETVLTCKGDYYDPEFPRHLERFSESLRQLIKTEKQRIIIKKVEPWNSVRVTFNIPKEAAQRLRLLAEQGNQALQEIGVLAVQIEGDRVISLTIAGKNNERTELVLRTSDGPQAAPGLLMDGAAAGSPTKAVGSLFGPSGGIMDTLGLTMPTMSPGSDIFRPPGSVAASPSPLPGPVQQPQFMPDRNGPVPGPSYQPRPGMIPGQDITSPGFSQSPPGLSPQFASPVMGQSPSPGPFQSQTPPPPYPGIGMNNLSKSAFNKAAPGLLVNLLQHESGNAQNNGQPQKMPPPEGATPQKRRRRRQKNPESNKTNNGGDKSSKAPPRQSKILPADKEAFIMHLDDIMQDVVGDEDAGADRDSPKPASESPFISSVSHSYSNSPVDSPASSIHTRASTDSNMMENFTAPPKTDPDQPVSSPMDTTAQTTVKVENHIKVEEKADTADSVSRIKRDSEHDEHYHPAPANCIINPYTGQLEPMEGMSDSDLCDSERRRHDSGPNRLSPRKSLSPIRSTDPMPHTDTDRNTALSNTDSRLSEAHGDQSPKRSPSGVQGSPATTSPVPSPSSQFTVKNSVRSPGAHNPGVVRVSEATLVSPHSPRHSNPGFVNTSMLWRPTSAAQVGSGGPAGQGQGQSRPGFPPHSVGQHQLSYPVRAHMSGFAGRPALSQANAVPVSGSVPVPVRPESMGQHQMGMGQPRPDFGPVRPTIGQPRPDMGHPRLPMPRPDLGSESGQPRPEMGHLRPEMIHLRPEMRQRGPEMGPLRHRLELSQPRPDLSQLRPGVSLPSSVANLPPRMTQQIQSIVGQPPRGLALSIAQSTPPPQSIPLSTALQSIAQSTSQSIAQSTSTTSTNAVSSQPEKPGLDDRGTDTDLSPASDSAESRSHVDSQDRNVPVSLSSRSPRATPIDSRPSDLNGPKRSPSPMVNHIGESNNVETSKNELVSTKLVPKLPNVVRNMMEHVSVNYALDASNGETSGREPPKSGPLACGEVMVNCEGSGLKPEMDIRTLSGVNRVDTNRARSPARAGDPAVVQADVKSEDPAVTAPSSSMTSTTTTSPRSSSSESPIVPVNGPVYSPGSARQSGSPRSPRADPGAPGAHHVRRQSPDKTTQPSSSPVQTAVSLSAQAEKTEASSKARSVKRGAKLSDICAKLAVQNDAKLGVGGGGGGSGKAGQKAETTTDKRAKSPGANPSPKDERSNSPRSKPAPDLAFFSSPLHRLTAPIFPFNLTQSVKKVVGPIPSSDKPIKLKPSSPRSGSPRAVKDTSPPVIPTVPQNPSVRQPTNHDNRTVMTSSAATTVPSSTPASTATRPHEPEPVAFTSTYSIASLTGQTNRVQPDTHDGRKATYDRKNPSKASNVHVNPQASVKTCSPGNSVVSVVVENADGGKGADLSCPAGLLDHAYVQRSVISEPLDLAKTQPVRRPGVYDNGEVNCEHDSPLNLTSPKMDVHIVVNGPKEPNGPSDKTGLKSPDDRIQDDLDDKVEKRNLRVPNKRKIEEETVVLELPTNKRKRRLTDESASSGKTNSIDYLSDDEGRDELLADRKRNSDRRSTRHSSRSNSRGSEVTEEHEDHVKTRSSARVEYRRNSEESLDGSKKIPEKTANRLEAEPGRGSRPLRNSPVREIPAREVPDKRATRSSKPKDGLTAAPESFPQPPTLTTTPSASKRRRFSRDQPR